MSLSSWVRSSLGIGSKPQKVEYSRWNEYLPEVFLDKYRPYIKAVFMQLSSHKPIPVVEFHSLPHDLLTASIAREKPMRAVIQERSAERNKIGQRERTRGKIQEELYELTPQSVPEVYARLREDKSKLYKDGSEVIVMQYLPYPPLSEMRVSRATMIKIVAQLKQTLDTWHDAGWYHCDFGFPHILVKKEGSFLSRRYHPYIIDYGDIVDCEGSNITGDGFNDFMELQRELGKHYGSETAVKIWRYAKAICAAAARSRAPKRIY